MRRRQVRDKAQVEVTSQSLSDDRCLLECLEGRKAAIEG
jgi:hypothetical protein